jgi:enediyne biosynthesis protein E3
MPAEIVALFGNGQITRKMIHRRPSPNLETGSRKALARARRGWRTTYQLTETLQSKTPLDTQAEAVRRPAKPQIDRGNAKAWGQTPIWRATNAEIRDGWRLRLFGISPSEAEFAQRGFRSTIPARRERLERIGRVFIEGYNSAVRTADPLMIDTELGSAPQELQGFAFEGAAMGFALLDLVMPWRGRRFARFITGPAAAHIYMAHVGAGWALARTSPHLAWRLGPFDPLLQWLATDGYGFHAGYFHHGKAIDQQHRPRGLRGYAANAFDQGLGRAVWFVKGAEIDAVVEALHAFPQERQSDLWSGVGLAAAYAGGIGEEDLIALCSVARAFRLELAQGAAFAAKARERAGNPAEHTERACRVFCGLNATAAAAITDFALDGLDLSDPGKAYAAWRAGICWRIASSPLFSPLLRKEGLGKRREREGPPQQEGDGR